MTRRSILALIIGVILNAPASACFCLSVPMCSQVVARRDWSAVFVGRVVDVWPPRETIADESGLSRGQLRQRILTRWRGALSVEEERFIRTTRNRGMMESRFAWLQRVRFVVSEHFYEPQVREIYTDASSCGFRFELGSTYLVVAIQDGPRHRTGACFRTSRVDSDGAVEDLKALRAWKSGSPLSPRIYGRIRPEHRRDDTRVRLMDDRGELAIPVGPDGRFSIDGLEKTRYRLQIEDSRGSGVREIDLSGAGCFEAYPWFSDDWAIGGTPALVDRPQVLLDPPMPRPGPREQ